MAVTSQTTVITTEYACDADATETGETVNDNPMNQSPIPDGWFTIVFAGVDNNSVSYLFCSVHAQPFLDALTAADLALPT